MNTVEDVSTRLFAALKAAGISIAEASQFLPVSRATLFNWKGGHTEGDQLRLDVVAGYTALIEKAIAAKALPLNSGFKKSERPAKIRKIIAAARMS